MEGIKVGMDMFDFVLFDYDGTLLDSTAITYESFKEAFAELGYGDLGLEFFRREFSMNHHEMYRKMGVRKEDVKKVEDIWWGYWDVMKGDIQLFPETAPALEKLHSLGVGIGLVSDGKGSRIRGDLEKFNIKKYFSVVVAREDANENKPSPKSLRIALERIKKNGSECIYVGDRVEDIHAGRAAGVVTGCVCNGIHRLNWLLKEEPDFVFRDVSGVVDIF
ncbi:HAD family hydrolase [Candidatus Micrarchaeota archaeon]|nr:HAD family hydrolase [Candidatus Micrarchaeota archaeon]